MAFWTTRVYRNGHVSRRTCRLMATTATGVVRCFSSNVSRGAVLHVCCTGFQAQFGPGEFATEIRRMVKPTEQVAFDRRAGDRRCAGSKQRKEYSKTSNEPA
jgi:hypothetical protein